MNLLCMISLFLLLQIIDVKAQNPSEEIPSHDPVTSNFQPSLGVVISMLAIMFSLTFILLLYAKFCHRAPSVGDTTSHQIQAGLPCSGVDKAIVESLPFFRFSSLRGSKQDLECSVCLAKFEDVEVLRLLPKCKHAFHIDCIDQWLEKHSNCPLCRRKVSADDLSEHPYSSSLRFLWEQTELREDSSLELYVEREENHGSSSRFSIIGRSFRKTEEELPIPETMDREEHQPLHRFNHTIVVSDRVVLKNRWSNVSSSDLMCLNIEMFNADKSSARLDSRRIEQKCCVQVKGNEENMTMVNIKEEMERKRAFERKIKEIKRINGHNPPTTSDSIPNPIDKRSMSDITVHPRFSTTDELKNKDSTVAEERMRRLWLPIATKTVQWFANRETKPPQPHGLNV